jgi:hypothetical protein
LRAKRARVLCVLKNIERGPKNRFLAVFAKKGQKSDFPRKRSQNPKKVFRFVTIKKNFFFRKLFREFEFWTYFFMSIFDFLKKVLEKWIFFDFLIFGFLLGFWIF